jgi:hypothetical protein
MKKAINIILLLILFVNCKPIKTSCGDSGKSMFNLIRDEETAESYAEAILRDVFGDEIIDKELPLKVETSLDSTLWLIYGNYKLRDTLWASVRRKHGRVLINDEKYRFNKNKNYISKRETLISLTKILQKANCHDEIYADFEIVVRDSCFRKKSKSATIFKSSFSTPAGIFCNANGQVLLFNSYCKGDFYKKIKNRDFYLLDKGD